jgi:hypothetical protein
MKEIFRGDCHVYIYYDGNFLNINWSKKKQKFDTTSTGNSIKIIVFVFFATTVPYIVGGSKSRRVKGIRTVLQRAKRMSRMLQYSRNNRIWFLKYSYCTEKVAIKNYATCSWNFVLNYKTYILYLDYRYLYKSGNCRNFVPWYMFFSANAVIVVGDFFCKK